MCCTMVYIYINMLVFMSIYGQHFDSAVAVFKVLYR